MEKMKTKTIGIEIVFLLKLKVILGIPCFLNFEYKIVKYIYSTGYIFYAEIYSFSRQKIIRLC